jgi:hypothetical protein
VPRSTSSPPTPTSRTRCGTRLHPLWARPSSPWSVTPPTN